MVYSPASVSFDRFGSPILTVSGIDGVRLGVNTTVSSPVIIAGFDGSTTQVIQTDNQGRILVVPASANSNISGFCFGETTLATANVAAPVRKTTLIEQTSNSQRSIVSTSANDTAAGTGARQIKIIYYTSTGTGPFTEVITLNGITAVNTVNTNICYIEEIEVVSVGSVGSNVGIITLKAGITGSGATIGTIAVSDNKTLWALHYIPVGKVCNITSLSVHNNSSAAGNGCSFFIKAFPLGGTFPDSQISDVVRVFGQSSSIIRNYPTPLQITGPARIQVWAIPESGVSIIERASFDFYEE